MERFGRYELVKRIAAGGMAEIHLARQAGPEGFEKYVVIKRILPHLADNREFVEMFLQEARLAVRLNHPNIVQVFDLGEVSGSYFIAMEYIHGEDLRRMWRQSESMTLPAPVPLVCRIIMEAAAGLDYAHKKVGPNGELLHIVHRDVSPQNILLSFEGAVKVVDFGIAKATDQASHTHPGVLKGKYSYMSPEQASGKDTDWRTDQFALGVVLYELLTLTRLFKRRTEIQTLAAVSECVVPPPSEVNQRVPRNLDSIVLKALAKNPSHRFRDMNEMRLALEEWLLHTRQPSSTAHLANYMTSLYANRLAKENVEGVPIFSDSRDSSTSMESRRVTRTADARRSVPPRLVLGEETERTPYLGTSASSLSRFLVRRKERKKATAIWLAAASALLAILLLYQSKVGSTTNSLRDPITLDLSLSHSAPPALATGNEGGSNQGGSIDGLGPGIAQNTDTQLVDIVVKEEQGIGVSEPKADSPAKANNLASAPIAEAVPNPSAGPHSAAKSRAEPSKLESKAVQKFGTLVVTSEPPAAVWEGRNQLGDTPLSVRMTAGRHQLALVNRERELERSITVNIKPNETINKPFSFGSGEVQVLVKPSSMNAEIYLRGRQIGSNPLPKFSLLEGAHQLTVVSEELHKTKKVAVVVKPGELTKVIVDFEDESP